MTTIVYHEAPELLEGLMAGILNIQYTYGYDITVYEEAATVHSDLTWIKYAYETTYDSMTNCLATLWSSVQTSIGAHTSLYLLAGFTNLQLTNISATYTFLES